MQPNKRVNGGKRVDKPFKLYRGVVWIDRGYFESQLELNRFKGGLSFDLDALYSDLFHVGELIEANVERSSFTGKITWMTLLFAAALAGNIRFSSAHQLFLWLKEIIESGKIDVNALEIVTEGRHSV
jgi:hypothetical protein